MRTTQSSLQTAASLACRPPDGAWVVETASRIIEGSGSGKIVGARASQQDSFLVERLDETATLAIVADGMGGHPEGELASRTAATAFRDAFITAWAHRGELGHCFDQSLEAANRAIAEAQRGHPEREGMGTTLLAAHLSRDGVAWVNVGDSLLLLQTGEVLRRLSEDHSLRGLSKSAGVRENMLRSAVMGGAITLVDRQAQPVRLGRDDRIVLATDGVLTLSMERIAALLEAARAQNAQAAVDGILMAVERSGDPRQDNCTVLVLDAPRGGTERARQFRTAPTLVIAALGLVLAGVVLYALLW